MLGRLQISCVRCIATTSRRLVAAKSELQTPPILRTIFAQRHFSTSQTEQDGSSSNDKTIVHMTDECAERLRKIGNGKKLRLTVDGGGCSGFEYKFTLDESNPDPSDHKFEHKSAVLLIDDLSMQFLNGATVDYSEELIRSGFKVVNNPIAEQGCSCGSSFAPRLD